MKNVDSYGNIFIKLILKKFLILKKTFQLVEFAKSILNSFNKNDQRRLKFSFHVNFVKAQ